MTEAIKISNLGKSFTLHNQGGRRLDVLSGLKLDVSFGDCVALTGESGTGKSTLMRMVYGNYHCLEGSILLRHKGEWVDMANADPRLVLEMRRETIGYVSQFLRVLPRVPALDVVAEPLRLRGTPAETARERAAELLARLNLPAALWSLSPTTFSGGEQQRVNIARGFSADYPILLLDEPTASLDQRNRQVVLDLITEARDRGAAILGIFHDAATRDAVCLNHFDVTRYRPAA